MCLALPYRDEEQLQLLPRLRADRQLRDDDAGAAAAHLRHEPPPLPHHPNSLPPAPCQLGGQTDQGPQGRHVSHV